MESVGEPQLQSPIDEKEEVSTLHIEREEPPPEEEVKPRKRRAGRQAPLSKKDKEALARGRKQWNIRRREAMKQLEKKQKPKQRVRDVSPRGLSLSEVKFLIEDAKTTMVHPKLPTPSSSPPPPPSPPPIEPSQETEATDATRDEPTISIPVDDPPPPVPDPWSQKFGFRGTFPTLRRTGRSGRRPRFY